MEIVFFYVQKKRAAGVHCSFLDDRNFIPFIEEYGPHYVTAMLPPQENSDEYYCQINSSSRYRERQNEREKEFALAKLYMSK